MALEDRDRTDGNCLSFLQCLCRCTGRGEESANLLLCHRVESTVGAPTLEQQPSKYLVTQTHAYKSGKRVFYQMQANVERLSTKDIQDISDYFSSQRAKPARFATEPDAKTIALGAASAKQLNCAKCHSEDYRGGKDFPRLAGQVPTYLMRQIAEFKGGARPHPVISKAAEKLSDRKSKPSGCTSANLSPNPAANRTRRFMASIWRAAVRRAGYLTR